MKIDMPLNKNIKKKTKSNFFLIQKTLRGCPRGVMVKSLDSGIGVSEFELQSRYCVHFRKNTQGKGMNPLILLAMGYIASLLFFY